MMCCWGFTTTSNMASRISENCSWREQYWGLILSFSSPRPLSRACTKLFFVYLVQSFEEQDVFAGILKPAALLVSFGVYHSRLGVLVLVLVWVVRLCTHCGGTRMTWRRHIVEGTRYQCSSLLTWNSAAVFTSGGLWMGGGGRGGALVLVSVMPDAF